MDLFCFGCGTNIPMLPTATRSSGCLCSIESLSQISLKPSDSTRIDLTLHYPSNYGLLTEDANQLMILTEDMDIIYTLYSDSDSVIDS
jgi:hypothetical protein